MRVGKTVLLGVAVGLAACGSTADLQPSTTSVASTASSVETTTSVTPSTSVTTTVPATTSPQTSVMPHQWTGLSIDQTEISLINSSSGKPAWLLEISDTNPMLGASLVRMGTDGQTYVDTCCEPAAGEVYVIDGVGPPLGASVGYFPALSPDGRWLASTNGTLRLLLVDLLDRPSSFSLPDIPEAEIPIVGTDPIGLTNLSWSLDSVWLAFNYHTNAEVPSLLILEPTPASSVEEASVIFEGATVPAIADETALSWYLPVFTDLGLLVAATEMHPPFDLLSTVGGVLVDLTTGQESSTVAYEQGLVVDQDVDVSGHYVIYVLSNGSVHWLSTSGEAGLLAEEGFRSASW